MCKYIWFTSLAAFGLEFNELWKLGRGWKKTENDQSTAISSASNLVQHPYPHVNYFRKCTIVLPIWQATVTNKTYRDHSRPRKFYSLLACLATLQNICIHAQEFLLGSTGNLKFRPPDQGIKRIFVVFKLSTYFNKLFLKVHLGLKFNSSFFFQ
jgi:hypothetical protein